MNEKKRRHGQPQAAPVQKASVFARRKVQPYDVNFMSSCNTIATKVVLGMKFHSRDFASGAKEKKEGEIKIPSLWHLSPAGGKPLDYGYGVPEPIPALIPFIADAAASAGFSSLSLSKFKFERLQGGGISIPAEFAIASAAWLDTEPKAARAAIGEFFMILAGKSSYSSSIDKPRMAFVLALAQHRLDFLVRFHELDDAAVAEFFGAAHGEAELAGLCSEYAYDRKASILNQIARRA